MKFLPYETSLISQKRCVTFLESFRGKNILYYIIFRTAKLEILETIYMFNIQIASVITPYLKDINLPSEISCPCS